MILLAIVGAAVACSILFLLLRSRNKEQTVKTAPQQAYRMQVVGLNFKRMNQGRMSLSITADRFIIRRGKIGFFSTGITSAARIENVQIDIYEAPPSVQENSVKQQLSGESSDSGRLVKAGSSQIRAVNGVAEKWNFEDLFAEETFSSLLPTKNISTIEAVPVTVRLHGEQGIMTQISAATASVRLKDRKILFNGRVRVLSGGSELSTEQVIFAPMTARLMTDKRYVLKRGGRTIRGSGLKTDIFLSATDLR